MPRILALETTGTGGSVAALDGQQLIAAQTLAAEHRSARSLTPAIVAVCQQAGWALRDVQLVAVTVGPGSFTGLRVGVTTAKLLAYVAGADVLGVDALEAIAAQSPADVRQVWSAMDAQRGELVVRAFERAGDGRFRPQAEQTLAEADAWLAERTAAEAITGPVLHRLLRGKTTAARVLPPAVWDPTAATVGHLAWLDYSAGRRDDVWTLLPRYSRQAAAEEKWQQRQASP